MMSSKREITSSKQNNSADNLITDRVIFIWFLYLFIFTSRTNMSKEQETKCDTVCAATEQKGVTV